MISCQRRAHQANRMDTERHGEAHPDGQGETDGGRDKGDEQDGAKQGGKPQPNKSARGLARLGLRLPLAPWADELGRRGMTRSGREEAPDHCRMWCCLYLFIRLATASKSIRLTLASWFRCRSGVEF